MPRDVLSPDLVLAAYAQGVFPMAHPEEGDRIYWYAPDPRAILPLDAFHVPHNLRRTIRKGMFEISTDTVFMDVIEACAERDETWISREIIEVFSALHGLGYAHSVEVWSGGELAGGLYGVALGRAFFGESMFHRKSDASKVALVHLVRRLRAGGFTLLDTQFTTPHLERFGVVEVPRADYEQKLDEALSGPGRWDLFMED